MEKQRRQKVIFRIFLFASIALMISLFFINKAWPAEPVNSVPEVENWAVVGESTIFEGTIFDRLFIRKTHRDPNNPNKLGFTIWFPNKDKNYEYEVFVRVINFVKNDNNLDRSQAKSSIKLENGYWSEVVVRNKTRMSLGMFNSELAAIFRILDDNGETKYFRAFLLKDLVKPKD